MAPLTVADSDAMVAVYADDQMHAFTGSAPLTATELRDRYRQLAAGWNHDRSEQWCNWIVRMNGNERPIGAMQATIACDLSYAEVAWEIAVEQQSNGFASEAASVVINYLLERGAKRITASIHPQHDASAAVARKAGMVATTESDDGEVVWEYLFSRP